MIWTKLTRTDDVFSRAACMVYLCAGKRIFRCLRKIHEKSQKIHAPEGTRDQKWDQRGARGCPGALWARPPWAAPGGRLGGPHTPWCPTLARIFPPEETKCQKWGQRGARGCPGALWARPPWAAPGGRLGGAHTPWCPTLPRIFTRDTETPDQKFFSQFSVAEPPPPSVLPREG